MIKDTYEIQKLNEQCLVIVNDLLDDYQEKQLLAANPENDEEINVELVRFITLPSHYSS